MANQDRLAVNKRIALKMFWDAGWDTEALLTNAHLIIEEITQPSTGYWYADDISNAIELNKVK
jgi:hypothetical protein